MSLKAIAAALLGATLVVPGAAQPNPVAAATGVGTCTNGWQELYIPDGYFNHIPQGAIVRNGRLEWVVGGGAKGPLGLRWNGNTLVARMTGSKLRRGLADGVTRGSGRWLVGGYQRPSWGAEISPLVGRYVGNRFYKEPVAISGKVNAAVADVVTLPNGRGYGVGSYLDRGHWKALVLTRRGGRWNQQNPFSRGGSGLLGVTKTPKQKVWAVGWRVRSGKMRPLILRRDKGRWTSVSAGKLPSGPAVLTDISIPRGGRGFAIGYLAAGNGPKHTPILLAQNGGTFRRVSLPWAGTSAIPQSLHASANGELWIAGTQLANDNRETRGFVAHRQGGRWTMRYVDTPPDVRSSLQSVDATSDGAVVTGTIAATAFVLRTCDLPQPDVASGGDRKLKVSGINKRKKARELHEVDDGMPTFASPSAVQLAAPTKPSGFVVRDMAGAAGLRESTRTYKALVADFDKNGWKDVFISRHQGLPKLALNDGGTFTDAPTTAFSPVDRHTCDVGDVDGNGWKDIICITGRRFGTSINHHELSYDVAGPEPRFDRKVAGIADPLGRGRSVTLIKLNRDKYPEAYTVAQPEREDVYPSTNGFYRNDKGRFRSAPGIGLDRPLGGYCADGRDVDGDGDQDLLLCVRFPADNGTPGLRIYRNEAGRLRDRTAALGVKPIGDRDVAMADVNGDGKRDLIQLAGNRVRVSKRVKGGFKKIAEIKMDKTVALATGDVNGDRRADIYVVRGGQDVNRADRLLVNNGKGTRWTSVKIPQAGNDKGRGDDVVALDYDRNGLTDFVVLNGKGKDAGPIQLLASFRR
ncbi:MAG: VCBS repeat-containing protein [Candidatus Limnocylindrales bacterium]